MTAQHTPGPDGERTGKKGRARKILIALPVVAALAAVAIAALPAMLSSDAGTRLLARIASGRINGSVSLQSLSLNWRSAQVIEGLVIRDSAGEQVLSIERMVNDRTLWSLARSRGDELGLTTVTGAAVDIVADADGDTNLMKALRVPGPAEKETGLVPVLPFGSLVMEKSRVVVTTPKAEPVVFTVDTLEIDLPAPQKPLRVDLAVETRQGKLAGRLDIRARAENVVDDRRRLQPLAARVDLEGTATNLPVDGLDGAFGFGGLLSGALGRRADLQVRTRAALDRAELDFTFAAPLLQARIGSVYEKGILRLSESGKIDFTLSPDFAAALLRTYLPESALRLENEAPITVVLEEMRVPVIPPDPAGATLTARLTAGKALRFDGIAEGVTMTVKTLEMSVDAAKPSENITVFLASDLLLGREPGVARFSAIVSELFDGNGKLAPAQSRVKVDGILQNIPSALLDSAGGSGGAAAELLGPSFNAHFSAGNPEQGKTALDLVVESDRFKADTAAIVGKTVELARPVRIQARVTPRLVSMLGGGQALPEGASEVDLGITRLSLPLPNGGQKLAIEKVSFEAVATASPTAVSGGGDEILDLGVTRIEARANGLADITYSVTSHVTAREGAPARVAGTDPLALDIAGEAALGGDLALEKLSARLKAGNRILNVSTAVEIGNGLEELAMTVPLKAEWAATADQVGRMFTSSPGAYVPTGDMKASVRIEPATIRLKGFTPASLNAKASAKLPRLQLSRDGKVEAVVENIAVKADLENGGKFSGSARAEAAFPGGKGSYPLEASLLLENLVSGDAFDVGGADLSLELESRGLPTALAGMITEGASRLPALAGRQADVTALIRKSPVSGGDGEATVDFRSDRLRTRAEITLGKAVALKKPMALELTLTPDAWAALRGDDKAGLFSLAGNADIRGTVEKFNMPSKEGFSPGDISFRTGWQSDRIVLRQVSSGREVGLRDLTVTAAASPLAGGASISFRGALTGGEGKAGSLDAELTLQDMFAPDGRVNPAGSTLKLQARAGQAPVALVDGLLGLEGLAESSLGKSLDLTAEADVKKGEGPLSLRASASHARVNISGRLSGGTFTLTENAVGEIDVTEKLGSSLLNKIHPIFETVKTADEPLRLTVGSKGFSVPLEDFTVSRVNMPSLRVESNKMTLRKGGTLEMIVLLATQFGGAKGLGSSEEMEVWFTPLVAEMNGGVFRYSRRLDLLIDGRLHALSWGTASVMGEGRYDLYLGLPADALRKVLGTNRIGESEIFTFPLQGREGRVDTKGILAKASLDLGRVRGQYELSGKDPLLGLVAGEIVKKVIGTDTGPVPPPSVTPLPWEGLMEPEPVQAPESPPAGAPAGPAEQAPPPAPAKPQPEEIIRDVLDLFKK